MAVHVVGGSVCTCGGGMNEAVHFALTSARTHFFFAPETFSSDVKFECLRDMCTYNWDFLAKIILYLPRLTGCG